jgi:hypothetical protein
MTYSLRSSVLHDDIIANDHKPASRLALFIVTVGDIAGHVVADWHVAPTQ